MEKEVLLLEISSIYTTGRGGSTKALAGMGAEPASRCVGNHFLIQKSEKGLGDCCLQRLVGGGERERVRDGQNDQEEG